MKIPVPFLKDIYNHCEALLGTPFLYILRYRAASGQFMDCCNDDLVLSNPLPLEVKFGDAVLLT
jgi:hypothetical protein